MEKPTYEYRDGDLWICLSGYDSPAEMHAELLDTLALVLRDAVTDPSPINPDKLFPLFATLQALLPTAEHLKNGRKPKKSKQAADYLATKPGATSSAKI